MIIWTILKWVGIVAGALVVLFGLFLLVSMVATVIVMTAKGEHLDDLTNGDDEA